MVATQAQPTPLHESQKPLSEARFWGLIALLDWSKISDEEAVAAPLTAALAMLPQCWLGMGEKMWAQKKPPRLGRLRGR